MAIQHPLSRAVSLALFTLASMNINAASFNDTLVVTATRSATQISDIPGTVMVVEGDALRTQMSSGMDFKNALAQLIPALDDGSQGRTNYNQKMRGRSIHVMIDGVSLASSRKVSREFESIDPFNIDRVEVISGASAIYGGGATGGVINIITKKGQSDTPQVALQAGARSGFNTGDLDTQLAAAISGANGTLDYRLSGAYRQTGAFYDGAGEQTLLDITQTSSQYGQQIDLMGNLGVDLDDQQRLEGTLQYFKNRQDADKFTYFGPYFSGFKDPSLIEIRSGLELDDQPATERTLANLHYSHADLFGQQFYLQGYHRSEELYFNPFPRPDSVSASRQHTYLSGVKGVMVSQLTPLNTELIYGVDYSHERFDANSQYYDFRQAAASGGLVYQPIFRLSRYPDVTIDNTAAFIQANSELTPRTRLSGGVRYEHNNTEVGDFTPLDQQFQVVTGKLPSADPIPGGEVSYSAWLFNLGLTYDLTDDSQVYGNFSQGFEVPDPAKYYGRGVYQGSTLLSAVDVASSKAEAIKTDSIELGWRFNPGNWQAQVAAYYSYSDKRIDLAKKGQDLAVVMLDEEKRIYGLETVLDYRLSEHWSVGGNLHLMKQERKGDNGWEKIEAYFASNNKLGAHVDWQQGPWQLRLQGMKVFDYQDDKDLEMKGYHLFDLLGSYRLPVGELRFAINNLLDENYQTLWSQNAQLIYSRFITPEALYFGGRGRTLNLTYSATF